MPQDFRIGVLVIGAILLLAAVLSGTFRLFGSEIPQITGKAPRVLAASLGIALIIYSLLSGEPETGLKPQGTQSELLPGVASTSQDSESASNRAKPSPNGETRTKPTIPPANPIYNGPDLAQTASAAFLMCAAPDEPPHPPDGHTASTEQMISAMNAAKEFNNDTDTYLACLKSKAEQLKEQYEGVAPEAELAKVEILQVRLHNSAVDRDQAQAGRFNEQLRAFKRKASGQDNTN